MPDNVNNCRDIVSEAHRSAQTVEDSKTPFSLAIAIALLSILSFEAALFDEYRVLSTTAIAIGIELGILFGLGTFFRVVDARRTASIEIPRRDATLITILCLAAIPFAIELLIRSSSSDAMLPLELLLLVAFRNIVLATAVFAHRSGCQQVCCSLSLFLIIFATSLSTNRFMLLFLMLFAIAGMAWLVSSNRQSSKSPLFISSNPKRTGRWQIAWMLAVTPILLSIAITVSQPQVLSGFIPSSGGSESYNQRSRNGVGDGDDLIAGTENIQSFAPIEDAPFMSSHEPSLYDLYDDTYNEPVKIEKQERSIALSEMPKSTPGEAHPVDTQKAGKQFSTLRKTHERDHKIEPHASTALLYIKGRLPIHLKMEVFDRFDGIDWHAEELSNTSESLTMETIHDQPWLRLPISPTLEVYATPETHALKLVHLNTNRIPSPTQLLGIHIDKLDRSDFYQWAQPGLISMDREALPSGIVMNVQSRVADERLFEQRRAHLMGGPSAYRQIGTADPDGRIKKMAIELTTGVESGWPQVRAIVQHLRSEYRHDRESRPSPDCENTTIDFLFHRQGGPDYEFATAAVMLLRSLNISARLASGFYVDQTQFDPRAGHTPVTKDDVHVWAEVHAGKDHWLPIEPTPGYDLLKPPATAVEHLISFGMAIKNWIASNVLLMMGVLLLGFVAYRNRHDLIDVIHTLCWRLQLGKTPREVVLRSSQLLLQRSTRVHRQASRSLTISRWLEQAACPTDLSEQATFTQFKQLVEWAMYSTAHSIPPFIDVDQICHRTVSTWSLARFRRGPRSNNSRTGTTPWSNAFIRIWQCGETW